MLRFIGLLLLAPFLVLAQPDRIREGGSRPSEEQPRTPSSNEAVSMPRVAAGGTVVGEIRDGEEPLAGVTVLIRGTQLGAYTDVDGVFQLSDVPPGPQTLVVLAIGFDTLTKDVSVLAGQRVSVGILDISGKALEVEGVLIEGTIKESEARAMFMTMEAQQIANIVAASSIGKLPDRNAAEALQRVQGVALERDQGEGRYVSVRGTPADWSSALVNGDRLPVADELGDSRALAFDIFPSEAIEYIVLSKAITPDIEGDAIGGSMNFITRGAPSERTLSVNFGGGHNFQAQRPVFNGSVLWGDRTKNKKFGYLVAGNVNHRNYGNDNFEVVYGSNVNHGLNRLELRDYLGKRTTVGTNLALEYNPNEKLALHFKGLYGRMNDDEVNRKHMFFWGSGDGQQLRLQNIHSITQMQFFGGEIGAEWKLSERVKLDAKYAYYDNRFGYGPLPAGVPEEQQGYYVLQYQYRAPITYLDETLFDAAGNVLEPTPLNRAIAFDKLKLLAIDDPVYGDPADRILPVIADTFATGAFAGQPIGLDDFIFNQAFAELNTTQERDPVVAAFNISFDALPRQLELKFGGKVRMKEGFKDVSLFEWFQDINVFSTAQFYEGAPLEPLPLRGGFLTELGAPYDNLLQPFIALDYVDNFIQNKGDTLFGLPMDRNNPDYEEWLGSSYSYTEDVYAGYAMFDWRVSPKVRLIGGFRHEYTDLQMKSDTLAGRRVFFDINRGTVVDKLYTQEVTSTTRYHAPLPMLHVKYTPKPNMNVRFAAVRTFRRPYFNEAKPGMPVFRFTDLEFEQGNPNIKPSYSWNFDLMTDYFFKDIGLLQAGVFYKYVTDHIFASITSFDTTSSTALEIDPLTQKGFVIKEYSNADASWVAGFEIGINKRLSFLPGILGNFGVTANYTYTKSRMSVPGRTANQPLPRQSDHLANFALYYEDGEKGFNARLALNYKGPYLLALNLASFQDPVTGDPQLYHDNTDYDVFLDDFLSMDLSISWKFWKGMSVYGEANNLLNWPFRIYRGDPQRPMQEEYYSVRGLLGLRYQL